MSDKSNARPGYSDSPDSPFNGRVINGSAPSAFVRRQPGGALYNEPVQSDVDGKSVAEYNLAHGREGDSRTAGGQPKAKKS